MISAGVLGLGLGLLFGLIIGGYGILYIVDKEGLFDAKSNSRHQK